jgi:hypothetical protein
MSRYEAREIDGRWAIFDTVESRVTGWFGRGVDEGVTADVHAAQMNEALLERDREDAEAEAGEPVSLHAAIARHEVVGERDPRRGGQAARDPGPW